MGVFAKYRKFYREPERISVENARLNRITAELQKNIELQERFNRLSPVTRNIVTETRRVENDRLMGGHKAASIAAALSAFKERDFADPAKRAEYRTLRQMQEAWRAGAQPGGQQKVKPAGSDKRQYNPTGKEFASTKYGTIARLQNVTHRLTAAAWVPAFVTGSAVIPCVQRLLRREVMFALGKAGRGYRVRHRRTWSSGVPC